MRARGEIDMYLAVLGGYRERLLNTECVYNFLAARGAQCTRGGNKRFGVRSDGGVMTIIQY